MQIYLAPMEGITTYVYRRAFENHFGKIDRYFTPFIANKKMAKRDKEGILPENNPKMKLIPQILTNSSEDFLYLAEQMAGYGYDTLNLNLGCPSGTVVSKKRGAGFLSQPEKLEAFLTEIYEKCPLKISLKTRIGMEEEEEWEKLLSVYEKFPMEELIIHPRLRKDFYQKEIRWQAFEEAVRRIKVPLCYNGEINSLEDLQRIRERFPTVERFMIGRGILRNPGLVEEIRNSEGKETGGISKKEYSEKLQSFHEEIYREYQKIMCGDRNTLFKMKELWSYLSESFEGEDKALKKIKKANNLREYEIEVSTIFRNN